MILEIKGAQAKEYLKKFEYDFDQIASCLKVEGNKLILLNPFF